MLTERQLRDVMQRVLSLTKAAEPKAQARVLLSTSHGANTRFARNEVTTSGENDEADVSLVVGLGKREASTGSNQIDDASLKALVERTVAMAKVAPENPEVTDVLGPQKYGTQTLDFDSQVDAIDATTRAQAAKVIIDQAKAKSLQLAGFFTHSTSRFGRATSAGAFAVHASTDISLSVTARSEDGTGSGYASAASHLRKDIDFAALAARACDTAIASRQPKKLDPGAYTVVLEPLAVESLAGSLLESLDARSTDEGRSFFSKNGGSREHEQLASRLVTLKSDWSSALTPGAPFDGEAFALKPTTWIDKGVITTLSCSRYWAAKKNRAPTGNHSGFQLSPGSASRDALIRGVKRGVLINRFWYTNWVDQQTLLLTGLTRDGIFLIENGEIVGPVNNFRFNQSVMELFANVEALGSVLQPTSSADIRVPALRAHDFHLASPSDAV